MPGKAIMKYLLECYFYGRDENLSYGGLWLMDHHKPVGLTASQAHKIGDELTRLLPLFLKAVCGDAEAQGQVKIIKQVANPRRRGLPPAEIKAFFDKRHRFDRSLARAFKIVVWMGQIDAAVTRLGNDEFNEGARGILHGEVKLLSEDRARVFSPIYERVKAAFKRSNNTLESLAISIYHDELKQEGINVPKETLRKDLAAYKKWKPEKGEETIPVSIHTVNGRGEFQGDLREELLIGFSTNDWKEDHRRPRGKK
jgi:hypothetical protein